MTPPLLVGIQTCTVILKINMVVPHRIGNQFTSRSSDIILGHKPKGCSIIPQEHLLTYVHSSYICNRQNQNNLDGPKPING